MGFKTTGAVFAGWPKVYKFIEENPERRGRLLRKEELGD